MARLIRVRGGGAQAPTPRAASGAPPAAAGPAAADPEATLRHALSLLGLVLLLVLARRMDGDTREEVARLLGVGQRRVRRLEEAALAKLAQWPGLEGLEEHLT